MAEVGSASLGIIPSFDGFERNLSRGAATPMARVGASSGSRFGDAAGKSAGSRFGGAFKTAAKASLVGLGALGVGAFKLAGDAVSAASDLEESTNKVTQVFGKGADDVFRFSEKAADALGQTNQQARDAAASFGIFGNVAKLSGKENAKFAKRMTRLSSDLASFNNTEPEQAIEAIGAALRGEAEPIRAYGVLLDEATLKAEAMRIGLLKPVKDQAKIQTYQVAIMKGQKAYNEAVDEFGPKSLEALDAQAKLGYSQEQLRKATEGTVPQLTAQQKVLAAQSSILRQTSTQQGDFARTSDGLANQQRRLKARFEDAKASLGEGLLPIMTDAADFLLDKGIPAFEDFSDWFNDKGLPAIQGFGDEVKQVAGKVEDLLGFLGDLPNDAKIGGFAALAGGAVLRGRRGGGLSGATGALGIVKTFETNPATFGASGIQGSKYSRFLGKLGFAGDAITAIMATAGAGVFVNRALAEERKKRNGPELADSTDRKEAEIRRMFEQGGSMIRDTASDVARLRTNLDAARGPWRVGIEAPQLPPILQAVKQYEGILDGLNGRVVRTHIQTVVDNNVIPDIGGNGGRTPRATTNDNRIIINGDIRPADSREFERDLRRKQRARSGGGR